MGEAAACVSSVLGEWPPKTLVLRRRRSSTSGGHGSSSSSSNHDDDDDDIGADAYGDDAAESSDVDSEEDGEQRASVSVPSVSAPVMRVRNTRATTVCEASSA